MYNLYTVYGRSDCHWTRMAIEAIEENGDRYTFMDIDNMSTRELRKVFRSGCQSYPQMFCNGEYVGGYNDLVEDWMPDH